MGCKLYSNIICPNPTEVTTENMDKVFTTNTWKT